MVWTEILLKIGTPSSIYVLRFVYMMFCFGLKILHTKYFCFFVFNKIPMLCVYTYIQGLYNESSFQSKYKNEINTDSLRLSLYFEQNKKIKKIKIGERNMGKETS